MIILNTTKKVVSMILKGTKYSVESEGEVEVSNDVAQHWLSIHAFLIAKECEECKAPKVEIEDKEEIIIDKKSSKKEKKVTNK